MTKPGIAVLLASVLAAPAGAQDCSQPRGARGESARYVLSYVTRPEAVTVGRHFSVELAVCAKPGQTAPKAVRVDAFMPAHNHGMNYRATVKRLPDGRYVAEGMMFHMPGQWDLVFEIQGGGRTDRVTHSLVLR